MVSLFVRVFIEFLNSLYINPTREDHSRFFHFNDDLGQARIAEMPITNLFAFQAGCVKVSLSYKADGGAIGDSFDNVQFGVYVTFIDFYQLSD
jgi:hypothetical protein